MAENTTATPPPPPARVATTDLAALNKKLDAGIARDLARRHAKRKQDGQQQADAADQAKAAAAAKRLNPLQRTAAFVEGTVGGVLGGLSGGARRGAWLGAAMGLLGCIALGSTGGGVALIAMGFLGMSVAGAAVGGSIGLLTGGAQGMRKASRRMQADATAKPEKQGPEQSVDLPSREDVREAHRRQSIQNYVNFHQQDVENQRDARTYWQDRVQADAQGFGPGRG